VEPFFSITAAKEVVSLVTALAELAKHAEHSNHPAVAEVLYKLKGEAYGLAVRTGHTIDEVVHEIKILEIDDRETFRTAQHAIGHLNLIKRLKINQILRRFDHLRTRVKDFYGDVESLLTCSDEKKLISIGIDSAYDARKRVDAIDLNATAIKDAIGLLREMNDELLAALQP
jgi:hypothetical protein